MENSEASISPHVAVAPPLYGYLPPDIPQRPRSSPWKLILGIFLVIIFFVALGVGGYQYYLNLPEQHTSRVFQSLRNLRSFEYTSELRVEQRQQSSEDTTLGYYSSFRGQSDFSSASESATVLAGGMRMTGGAGGEIFLSGQGVFVDNAAYIRLSEIPETEMGFLSSYTNRWTHFSKEQASSSFRILTSLYPELFFVHRLFVYQDITSSVYSKHSFIFVEPVPTEEVVNSIPVFHYVLSFNSDSLFAFLQEIAPLIDSGDVEEAYLKAYSVGLSKSKLHLWIGKNDDLIYKIAGDVQVQFSNELQETRTITFSSVLSKHNSQFIIAAPSDGIEYTNVVLTPVTPEPVVSSSQSRDAVRLADLDALRKAIDARIIEGSDLLPKCVGSVNESLCSSYSDGSNPAIQDSHGDGWIPLDVSDYLVTLPVDPLNGKTIVTASGSTVVARYYYRSDGTGYKLATYLEDPSNAVRVAKDGGSDPDLFEVGSDLSVKNGI